MRRKLFEDKPIPTWLQRESMLGKFNRFNVLNESVYYAGCQFDWEPITDFNGWARSFVYADYRVEKEDMVSSFTRQSGIEILFVKDVEKSKLQPYSNTLPRPFLKDFLSSSTDIEYVLENHNEYMREVQSRYPAFATWIVFDIKRNVFEKPKRCSLLYICGEGVATYSSLYNSNEIRPSAIVLTAADGGYGGNWTNFDLNGGIFERTVMSNNAGVPDYLITWHLYNPKTKNAASNSSKNYWDKYVNEVFYRSSEERFSIWKNSDLVERTYFNYD
jgi:hypothetical protein